MKKILMTVLALAACSTTPKSDPEKDALIKKHRELFEFMGLSKPAVDELLGKVAWVHDGMKATKEKNPEAYHALEGITKRGNPKTEQEALARHADRYKMLGLTPATEKELCDAFVSVYRDLHSAAPSERAKKIQTLMAQLPPCCDDAVFERAGAKP